MNFGEVLGAAREALTVRRVYGEPYEKDGVTVLPAATVSGCGCGCGCGCQGEGDCEGEEEGSGGGFKVTARPAGVYVLSGDRVRWRPAVDVNRLVTAAAAVGIVFLVTRSRIVRARLRAGTAPGVEPGHRRWWRSRA